MRAWAVAAGLAAAALACTAAAPGFDWRLPAGVAPPPVPADNPMSAAKVELGRRLFYDADLSVDGALACAGCHEQGHAFADPNRTHGGVHGEPGRRNVMGLANVGYLTPLTWADPGATSLERQVATPVEGERPVEMGMHAQQAEIVRRLGADACYRRMFAEAFPEERSGLVYADVIKALAAFERTLVSWNSPYDLARRGEGAPLQAQARLGERRFRADGCAACHAGPNFTDQRFHVLAPAQGGDLGAYEVTGRPGDRGAFRTPSLRNVTLTAPYFHDGSARTLDEALARHPGVAVPGADAAAIIRFLADLADARLVSDSRLSLPKSYCGQLRTH